MLTPGLDRDRAEEIGIGILVAVVTAALVKGAELLVERWLDDDDDDPKEAA